MLNDRSKCTSQERRDRPTMHSRISESIKPLKRPFRESLQPSADSKRPRTEKTPNSSLQSLPKEDLHSIEDSILGRQRHYNGISTLLKAAQDHSGQSLEHFASLCRVFCSLMIEGKMRQSSLLSEEERAVAEWLTRKYKAFRKALLRFLSLVDPNTADAVIKMFFELIRAEIVMIPARVSDQCSEDGTFFQLLSNLVTESALSVFESFTSTYLKPSQDVRALFIGSLRTFSKQTLHSLTGTTISRLIQLQLAVSVRPKELQASDELPWYFESLGESHGKFFNRFEIGEGWTLILKLNLAKSQRCMILDAIADRVAPAVKKPELLLDFLTDCCNRGGSEALLALRGLHGLIRDHGLEYPHIFTKLYEILDHGALHKKRRSRLIRLLEDFLSSTHLPVMIVASFIKRLSRLCLYSPPAAIVATIPLIYNLIRLHPLCGFLLQRRQGSTGTANEHDKFASDIFDAEQQDPVLTRAIDSSLWELDSLITHWHPNVATISRVLQEQFLKQSYDLEHFLDHSYQSLVTAEARKKVSRDPAVEYQISKSIFHEKTENNAFSMGVWAFDDVQ